MEALRSIDTSSTASIMTQGYLSQHLNPVFQRQARRWDAFICRRYLREWRLICWVQRQGLWWWGRGQTKPSGVSQAYLVTGCGPMPLDISVLTHCAVIRTDCLPFWDTAVYVAGQCEGQSSVLWRDVVGRRTPVTVVTCHTKNWPNWISETSISIYNLKRRPFKGCTSQCLFFVTPKTKL